VRIPAVGFRRWINVGCLDIGGTRGSLTVVVQYMEPCVSGCLGVGMPEGILLIAGGQSYFEYSTYFIEWSPEASLCVVVFLPMSSSSSSPPPPLKTRNDAQTNEVP